MAMVDMEKEDYLNKEQELLADTYTYKPIPKDPPSRLKNKLAQIIGNIKTNGGLSDFNYKRLYPICVVPPKFYVVPKYIKLPLPLRPNVFSRGSINYGMAKELANKK